MISVRVMKSLLVLVLLSASFVSAVPIEVGTGNNQAGLYIEWKDGFVAEFDVRFEQPTITGLDMFDIVEASNVGLTTVRQDFGWGMFIDGIIFDGHSNVGFGGGNDWWAHWVKNEQDNWVWGPGAADRIISNGNSDGWIYGRAGEPIPEPMTISLLVFGGLFLRNRKV